MKMVSSELDSFIFKFKQLWHSGKDAHIDIETHAGQAWVGLGARLGHAPGPLHHQPHSTPLPRKNDSPSRQRRRAALVAAKKEAEEAPKEYVDIAEESDIVGNLPEEPYVENI